MDFKLLLRLSFIGSLVAICPQYRQMFGALNGSDGAARMPLAGKETEVRLQSQSAHFRHHIR